MSLNHRVLGPVLMLAGLSVFATGWGSSRVGMVGCWLIGILLAGAGWMVFLKDRGLSD